jgi:hypothetical protein
MVHMMCRRLPGPEPRRTSTPQHTRLWPAQHCLCWTARAPRLCSGARCIGSVPASGPAAAGQEGVLQVFNWLGAVWGESMYLCCVLMLPLLWDAVHGSVGPRMSPAIMG